MIAVIDYGVGNIFSLYSSFRAIGEGVILTGDKEKIRECDKIVLPGVGAFADAKAKLDKNGLSDVIKEEAATGKNILGICLGMQMMFDKSFEYGAHEGLHMIPGEVRPIKPIIPQDYKVPHIGWNKLIFPKNKEKNKIFKYINEGDCVYFVHSYAAFGCEESLIAYAEYGADLTAAVNKDNVYATQFHPEKSGNTGLKILKAFCEL